MSLDSEQAQLAGFPVHCQVENLLAKMKYTLPMPYGYLYRNNVILLCTGCMCTLQLPGCACDGAKKSPGPRLKKVIPQTPRRLPRHVLRWLPCLYSCACCMYTGWALFASRSKEWELIQKKKSRTKEFNLTRQGQEKGGGVCSTCLACDT